MPRKRVENINDRKKQNMNIESFIKETIDEYFDNILVLDEAKPFKKGKGKAPKVGSGGRFKMCVDQIMKKNKWSGTDGEKRAKAICATIGRKKFGKTKFQVMAKKGKK